MYFAIMVAVVLISRFDNPDFEICNFVDHKNLFALSYHKYRHKKIDGKLF